MSTFQKPLPNTKCSRSSMRREIEEIPQAIERLFTNSGDSITQLAQAISSLNPQLFLTIARGSSDHCCGYLKYIFEIYGGRPVTSMGPSVASIYGTTLELKNSVTLAVSQSGKSPDIVKATQSCSDGGSCTIGLTNALTSPLSQVCDFSIDIQAGPETSVAATKTFINSIVAGLLLYANWRRDDQLILELRRLPELCERAIKADWTALGHTLKDSEALYVLGRGPSLSIAEEMALKFKEVCQIHAEAYSAAEVLHGPVSLLEPGFPILVLTAQDASKQSTEAIIDELAGKNAKIITNYPMESGAIVQSVNSGNPIIDPLLQIVSFYACIEDLALARGLDPDSPPHLNKVTQTL